MKIDEATALAELLTRSSSSCSAMALASHGDIAFVRGVGAPGSADRKSLHRLDMATSDRDRVLAHWRGFAEDCFELVCEKSLTHSPAGTEGRKETHRPNGPSMKTSISTAACLLDLLPAVRSLATEMGCTARVVRVLGVVACIAVEDDDEVDLEVKHWHGRPVVFLAGQDLGEEFTLGNLRYLIIEAQELARAYATTERTSR